jgi:AcrR family transcriptional regulator
MPGPKTSYHHGDLTRALVAVATEMAEEGGPDAVVLREAARRTGVSATAAYRHFEGQEDLLAHVAASAMADLSQWIQTAQARVPDGRDPRRRAIARWRAAGDAYVRFALAHPGLFRTAFSCIGQVALPMRDGRPEADPYQLLCDSLDDCVEVGALTPRGRVHADQLAWIGVHGLSVLALDGLVPTEGPLLEALLGRELDLLTQILDG